MQADEQAVKYLQSLLGDRIVELVTGIFLINFFI